MQLPKPQSTKIYILTLLILLACNTSQPSTKSSPTHAQAESQGDAPPSNLPSNQSDIPNEDFKLTKDNEIPPSDILEEVSFYGQGGRDCYDASYPEVKIDFPPTDEEILIESMMISCGWQSDEIVTGTIIYPDGRSYTKNIVLEMDTMGHTYAAKLRFTPTLSDPSGTYTFIIKGASGEVSAKANFRKPDGPRIYYYNDNQIILYGFENSEAVNVYCYNNNNGSFLGWQNYQVDSTGQLIIDIPINKCFFAAIGEVSGEVHLLEYLAHGGTYDWAPETIRTKNIDSAPEQTEACPGAPEQRLDIGDMAYVCTSTDSVKLREGPGKEYPVIKSLIPGADLEITGGPKCNNDWSWWQVKTESGYTGWMSEGGDNVDKYYLCPRN